jgi:serine O-acetyltransferase
VGVFKLIAADMREWKRMGQLGERVALSPLRLREALRLYLSFPGMRATVRYRLSFAAHQRRLPLVPGMLVRANLRRYGLDITPGIGIGPGLYIPHPTGTVIMPTEIGARCHIIHAVTVGMRNRHEFPRIGDDVTIGAGARVLGDVVVGSGANIGANAVVITNVPAGATVVGIPARVVRLPYAAHDTSLFEAGASPVTFPLR